MSGSGLAEVWTESGLGEGTVQLALSGQAYKQGNEAPQTHFTSTLEAADARFSSLCIRM